MPAYYINSASGFLQDSPSEIRDALTGASKFHQQLRTQTVSWENFIHILKKSLSKIPHSEKWGILLEYPIPRRSKRIDCVIIAQDIIIVIEFKDGASEYLNEDKLQLEDYCLDLRDFHFESNHKIIVPILLSAGASTKINDYSQFDDPVKGVLLSNTDTLTDILIACINNWSTGKQLIDLNLWNKSKYTPTPTIIEAAQTIYADKDIKEIIHHHADNLYGTTQSILNAIKAAKTSNNKIICFITGVPGAGKTLAGLNIIHNKVFEDQEGALGVFLSGNGPLVKVLSEALLRDYSKRKHIPKNKAKREAPVFIQNVHQFIDEYYEDENYQPTERIIIYDEAQRAWTREHKYRKSEKQIDASEPEILLSIMNRFENSWAVIIALVGGGQEINTGEGGLVEWGNSLKEKFKDWKVYVSPELKLGDHSTGNQKLFLQTPEDIDIIEDRNLHLSVTIRSYKAEKLSYWVDLILTNKPLEAQSIATHHLNDFPIFITRSLADAKSFLKERSRGTRRSGLVASSGGRRLRAIGLDINGGLKGTSTQDELGNWYLNPPTDIRSSNFLEVVASEFAVQGLELDWVGLCWDADLRRLDESWDFNSFKGSKWTKVQDSNTQNYLLNTYRVLLTRAREGMVIYLPYGSEEDPTRRNSFYNLTYEYLKRCGVKDLVLKK